MRVPFLGFVRLSPPSISSFSSRSFQRRTCSCRIFRKSVFFCSSFRASRTSGSMYMSFRICCSILVVEWFGNLMKLVEVGKVSGSSWRWMFYRTGLWSHAVRFLPSNTTNEPHKVFWVNQNTCISSHRYKQTHTFKTLFPL